MANKIPECQGCPYNKTKKGGGYGKLCNGCTMRKKGRCPEWRISEIIKATNKPYNRNENYHHIMPE